jgi:hypothetical protein
MGNPLVHPLEITFLVPCGAIGKLGRALSPAGDEQDIEVRLLCPQPLPDALLIGFTLALHAHGAAIETPLGLQETRQPLHNGAGYELAVFTAIGIDRARLQGGNVSGVGYDPVKP